MEKAVIEYVVNKQRGTREELHQKIQEIIQERPVKDFETAQKEVDWVIKKLEYLGYIRQGQDTNQKPTWQNTESAKEKLRLMRKPTVVDYLKSCLLKHVYGFSIKL